MLFKIIAWVIYIAFHLFCGYISKIINESKGYTGGFLWGLLLNSTGILIVAQKKEQPNAKENAFKAVLLRDVFKKFRYPFSPPQFEPIAMFKGEIHAEAEAAKLNLTFMIIHGLFMLTWYCIIISIYLWYIMGYVVIWLFKYYKKSNLSYGLKSKAEEFSFDRASLNKSEQISNKLDAIKNNVKSSDVGIGEKISSIELPTPKIIKEPVIEIPDDQKENIDYIINKYIETAGYMPAWKFEKFCNDRLNSVCDSAVSKYRIKVFTFYMRDLIPVITKQYKFNFLKLYELMTAYQEFFTDKSGKIDRNLLMKASMPIINKMISGGMLISDGEGFDAVFQSTVVDEPSDNEELPDEEAKVKPEQPTTENNKKTASEVSVRKDFADKPKQMSTPTKSDFYTEPVRKLSPVSTYSYASQYESSNKMPIIIAVILFLIIAAVIAGYFFIIKPKKNDNIRLTASVTEDLSERTVMTSTALTTETIETTVTTIESTIAAIKTTEPLIQDQEVQISDNKVEIFSVDNLSYYPQYEEILRGYCNGENSYVGAEGCLLCDLNNDNIAELIITRANNYISLIYTIFDNEAKCIADGTGNMSSGITVCENGVIVKIGSSGYSGGATYNIYNGYGSLDTIESVSWGQSGYHHTVGENTIEITETQLIEIDSKYIALNFDPVLISSLGLVSSAVNNIEMGKMYNCYHYNLLCTPAMLYGYLEDANGDGIDELITYYTRTEHSIYKYEDGNIKVFYPQNNSEYIEKTPKLLREELIALCRQKAVENGFDLNSNFTYSDVFGCVKTDGSTLNLRSGPSTAYPVVVELPNGLFFNILDSEGIMVHESDIEWFYISAAYNGVAYTGYVSKEFVDYYIMGID